jgi:thioester reductase-like protein
VANEFYVFVTGVTGYMGSRLISTWWGAAIESALVYARHVELLVE